MYEVGLPIKENTKKGYKMAYPGDSINLAYAQQNTRRGRVGRKIAHTLTTNSDQGTLEPPKRIRRLTPKECLRLQGWQVKHNDTFDTLYAHCSSICVTEGQQVKQGEVIGYVGTTGNSTGNHLHFEVWQNGERTDALGFFKAKE